MRGLYINCNASKIPASLEFSSQYSCTHDFNTLTGKGISIYNPYEWPKPPVFEQSEHYFVVYGWFVYENERNNLSRLASDIINQGSKILNKIQSGVFVIYWKNQDSEKVITDPCGLSHHFIDENDTNLRIAPAVKVLYREEAHPINEDIANIYQKKQHLFGNYTIFDGISRLCPASVTSKNEHQLYDIISKDSAIPLDELGEEFNRFIKQWNYNDRILPISSGLDSRLILANGEFKYGFTYGPENSPEINIASSFKAEFEHYHSYDYSSPKLHNNEGEIVAEMSLGSLIAIHRLLTNYAYVKDVFSSANVFYDGYCGDVFQRGTFINFKGVQGELLKIFPWLYRVLNWDAKHLLRKRNANLTEKEFQLVFDDFTHHTCRLELNDYQKITYYEFLYGRGGRYAIFGSNILAAQVFTVASPFADKVIFNSVIHQDFLDSVSYKTMKKMWSKVKSKYSKVKVESGYKPCTNIRLIPFIQIVYRIMFHVLPSRANYGVQQKRLLKKSAKK